MSLPPQVIIRQLREANGYLELGMSEHALGVLERLNDIDEVRVEIACLRGMALRELKRYREAIPPLLIAAEAQPQDINLWIALGWCYKRIGRLDLAIDALERARKVRPNEALILYNLACYWSLMKNKEMSLQYLARALSLDETYRLMIPDETDFDPLRGDPDFQTLTSIIV